MRTNTTVRQISALILVGSLAVLTASAANTTRPVTDKPAARHHVSVGKRECGQ